MWGEWDSEATRGMWWGCIMAGVVSKVSNIMLGKMVELSFRWLSFVYSA